MNLFDSLIHSAHSAAPSLSGLSPQRSSETLCKIAGKLRKHSAHILNENGRDLARMEKGNPDYDRLMLSEERISGIASDMEAVAALPVPYGQVIDRWERPNGMVITKVTVPFGVIGVIFEARPNVTADVFGLCFRSGSACVMKGGRDADFSSRAIVGIIRETLAEEGLPEDLCMLMPSERECAASMMKAVGQIDVIIPRGGRGLIDFVRENSMVPVIETGAGVCHTYVDASADTEKSAKVVFNAKTRRVSVCNALDCLIIHRSRLDDLSSICAPLKDCNVEIYADEEAYGSLESSYPASLLRHAGEDSFGTEFRDYKMAVKTVNDIDEAIRHISEYGSRHSECIMSEDEESVRKFQLMVDASCVYANVSTAFTDGGQFGFGAEIGISTQKLHARGPMALRELTTYKYLISGNGQTRN